MTVSACYITKNDPYFLEASFQSVKGLVDEIVVIDANSTDNTLEIANRYTDVVISRAFTNKANQRNKYLDVAKGDWIFVIDADEVYHRSDVERLIQLMNETKAGNIAVNFVHFWKDYKHIIKGHHWNQKPLRIFRHLPGFKYAPNNNNMVIGPKGRHIWQALDVVDSGIYVYHMAYLKPEEYIKEKIRFYLLRDHPKATEENVDEMVAKHPYFSGDFSQKRYGNDGMFLWGEHEKQPDVVLPFAGSIPAQLKAPIDISYPVPVISVRGETPSEDYISGMNAYMENHWQFNNHLDHERHQKRIAFAAKFCSGKTLEVGCANGFSTSLLKKANPEATFFGVEPTEWGYAQAVAGNPDITFFKAFAEDLPFPDETFDTVLLPEIIEHVEDPAKVLREAWRVTKSRLILTTPTVEWPDPDHKRWYPIEEMERFLKENTKRSPKFDGLDREGNKVDRIEDIIHQVAWIDR